ncbi:MAG: motility associated factor glycosyltransferase family protein [Epulopiscium sp.]|nr:motility associated factor glycosyltransferase family protein [Candidatus Epulonipiscium sp.]
MSSSLYEKNVQEYMKITGKNISLYEKNSNAVLEKTKDDNYTIKINDFNREIYIHSKYSPIKEGERFVQKLSAYNIKTVFIVYGMGLGYHILQLLKYLHKGNSLIIIEPNEGILSKAFSMYDWTPLMHRDKTFIFTGTNAQELKLLLGEFINISNVDNIMLLPFSQYPNIYSVFYEKVIGEIKNYVSLFKISKNTREHFWEQFNKNFFNNLYSIFYQGTINDLKNKFSNIPAFIVSAGPSLDKNIRELQNVKDRGIIFSGGRTLPTLINHNITPHFVVSMDPGIAAYNVLKDYGDHTIPLITTVVSNDTVISEHQGDAFYISNSEYRGLVKYFTQRDMDILPLGASVANASLSIAVYLGCNPIIFIGQDLAYTDGKYHADSCSDTTLKQDGEDNDLIEVEGIDGNKVLTNSVWHTFLMWMEKFIYHNSHKTYIDATEGGAKIHGTDIMTLRQAIEKYCLKNEFIQDKINTIIKAKKIGYQDEKLQRLLMNLKVDLEKVHKISSQGFKEAHQLLNKENTDEKDIRRLNLFETQLNDLIKRNEAVADILLRIINDIDTNNEFIEKMNESKEEKCRRLINRNVALHKKIEDTAFNINKLVQSVIDQDIEIIKIFQCSISFV